MRHKIGDCLPPRDEAAICALLATKLRAFRAGQTAPLIAPVDIERYDRRAIAGEFATVMAAAIRRARGD